MSNIVPPQDFSFYCDEAGISNDRFTVVGGICLHHDSIQSALDNMASFREKTGMYKELKWAKISNQKSREYSELVDYFFAMNNINIFHFHCLIFDSHNWRHNAFNQGDRDIGLSKLYYQVLLHKFARLCGPSGSLYVRLDHRNSSTSLHDLRRMLNLAAARDLNIANDPFKQIVSADSKECDLLQLNDVILGAVCAARNGKHLLATGRESKRTIAKMVLEKSGLGSFEQNTPRGVSRFSIWNFNSGR